MARKPSQPKTKLICLVDVPRSPERKIWMGPDRSTIGRANIRRMVKEMIASRYKRVPVEPQKLARRSA